MAQYLNEELQYVDDYFNIVEFDDEFGENKQKMDTSAGEARSGKDVQGIPGRGSISRGISTAR
ncbi:hypothetical protein QJS10_CPA09g00547 [Acorus calamus]|uniref:Uncharacterized protein n=1 Tax=Acorus calamus TaxID=4465 RepID=A0AAV9E9M0_ACOCL|nr:hypothetical protein QJS10_CPA09g00547 [Acorus calamus]